MSVKDGKDHRVRSSPKSKSPKHEKTPSTDNTKIASTDDKKHVDPFAAVLKKKIQQKCSEKGLKVSGTKEELTKALIQLVPEGTQEVL